MNSRKLRTRTLIQLGGLVQKSGLMDRLDIQVGDDLQEYENIHKAAQVLGCLLHFTESEELTEDILSDFEKKGERMLRYE